MPEPLSQSPQGRRPAAGECPHLVRQPVLELSAFKFRTSPACEMDDHKMYYSKRDLWPLLVRAGFKPSRIRLEYRKLCMILFATAIKQ